MNFNKPQDMPKGEPKKDDILRAYELRIRAALWSDGAINKNEYDENGGIIFDEETTTISRELFIKSKKNLAKVYEIWKQVERNGNEADSAEVKCDEETSVLCKELTVTFTNIFYHMSFITTELVKLNPDQRKELLLEVDSAMDVSAVKLDDTLIKIVANLNQDQRKELILELSKEMAGLLEKIEEKLKAMFLEKEVAERKVELDLFSERIGQFTEADLELDDDGACKTFENKIKLVFPEIEDTERLRAIKTAISMHFLEKYF